uniref:Transcription repressor n=1 Tax=Kalanchoe fedtschenkoi TaxID=63787 RepID=A0A7N0VB53_KALFE
MGNHKFRLSSIIPGLWHSTRKSPAPKPPEPPRSPRPQRPPRPRPKPESNKSLPVPSFDQMLLLSSPSSRSFRIAERVVQGALYPEKKRQSERPILAQPRRPSVYKSSNSGDYSPRRRKIHTKCCDGVRLKAKSPRINAVRTASRSPSSSSCSFGSEKRRRRRGLSERSVTVVKTSANPESDFKESMVEMIVENDITDLEGLEELLLSYLLLNSEAFHDVIVGVFMEIVIQLFRKTNK